MKPKLYLITKEFPYGHLEDSFVRPEYPYLCEKFDVVILSAEMDGEQKPPFNGAVTAKMISKTQNLKEKAYSFLQFLCEADCYRELWDILKSRKLIFKRIFRALMFGTAAETFYRRLKKAANLTHDTEALFYFYWFDYKCFGLTMHKKRYPGIKIIARAHGYDLFDERELYGRQLFKPWMDREVERLIFAAQFAKDYYLHRYQKADSEKYPLHRLGVPSKKIRLPDKEEICTENSGFLLLSCARAEKIKRIEKIVDGLLYYSKFMSDGSQMIKWIHIGGGSELENLSRYAENRLKDRRDIQYQFLGALTNDEVIRFYEEHMAGAFITTTETEGGSPVAVQEALSYGVPVIATAVGELPQMVKDNGILLSKDPDAKETAEAVARIMDIYGKDAYWKMRQASIAVYEEKFNAEKNFRDAAEEIGRLLSDS